VKKSNSERVSESEITGAVNRDDRRLCI
jgi:hypothetical protein